MVCNLEELLISSFENELEFTSAGFCKARADAFGFDFSEDRSIKSVGWSFAFAGLPDVGVDCFFDYLVATERALASLENDRSCVYERVLWDCRIRFDRVGTFCFSRSNSWLGNEFQQSGSVADLDRLAGFYRGCKPASRFELRVDFYFAKISADFDLICCADCDFRIFHDDFLSDLEVAEVQKRVVVVGCGGIFRVADFLEKQLGFGFKREFIVAVEIVNLAIGFVGR